MLTMWIISWIKVTVHVRSGKLRATVFTVIIKGIRKTNFYDQHLWGRILRFQRDPVAEMASKVCAAAPDYSKYVMHFWSHSWAHAHILLLPGWGEMHCGTVSCLKSTCVKSDLDLIKWAGQVHIEAFGAYLVVCNSSWAVTCCWS